MNRGEVQDVEAHRGDVRQPLDAIVKCAVAARNVALATRHHLIPGSRNCAMTIGDQGMQLRSGQVVARLALHHGGSEFGRQQGGWIAGLEVPVALPDNNG